MSTKETTELLAVNTVQKYQDKFKLHIDYDGNKTDENHSWSCVTCTMVINPQLNPIHSNFSRI